MNLADSTAQVCNLHMIAPSSGKRQYPLDGLIQPKSRKDCEAVDMQKLYEFSVTCPGPADYPVVVVMHWPGLMIDLLRNEARR